jgi:hypothetical protein
MTLDNHYEFQCIKIKDYCVKTLLKTVKYIDTKSPKENAGLSSDTSPLDRATIILQYVKILVYPII